VTRYTTASAAELCGVHYQSLLLPITRNNMSICQIGVQVQAPVVDRTILVKARLRADSIAMAIAILVLFKIIGLDLFLVSIFRLQRGWTLAVVVVSMFFFMPVMGACVLHIDSVPKMLYTKLMAVTLSILSEFSKFFHCWKENKIFPTKLI